MKLKVNKIALSLSTAFLMISSIVSAAVSAAEVNKITVNADRTNAGAGDRINVTVGFSPDDRGAAGFTLSLHYDPSKVEVYIPTEEETDTDFDLGGKFSVITNYGAAEDAVKIVGANLDGSNITEDTPIATASFTVKDSAEGDIDYWIEVETLVVASEDGYETGAYSAPSENSPYVVNGPVKAGGSAASSESAAKTTTAVQTTTTSETTTTAETTTTSETTTTAETTTSAEATSEEISSSAEETTSVITEAAPDETTAASSDEAAQTSQPVVTTSVEQTETSAQPVVTTVQPSSAPLFSYTQGENDFQCEEALQYGFRISDHITDYSQNYDVRVKFSTTGNISGAVGMMINGEWDAQYHESFGVSDGVWTYENLDPNISSDLIYMQVYYLKAYAQLDITEIEFVPAGTPVYTEAVTSQTAQQPLETQSSASETETSAVTSAAENTSAVTSVSSSEITTEEIRTEIAGEAQQSQQTEGSVQIGKTETEGSVTVTTAAEQSPESVYTENSTKAQEIINAVDNASGAAKQNSASNENPKTGAAKAGKTIMNILTAAAVCEILFSLFAVICSIADRSKSER